MEELTPTQIRSLQGLPAPVRDAFCASEIAMWLMQRRPLPRRDGKRKWAWLRLLAILLAVGLGFLALRVFAPGWGRPVRLGLSMCVAVAALALSIRPLAWKIARAPSMQLWRGFAYVFQAPAPDYLQELWLTPLTAKDLVLSTMAIRLRVSTLGGFVVVYLVLWGLLDYMIARSGGAALPFVEFSAQNLWRYLGPGLPLAGFWFTLTSASTSSRAAMGEFYKTLWWKLKIHGLPTRGFRRRWRTSRFAYGILIPLGFASAMVPMPLVWSIAASFASCALFVLYWAWMRKRLSRYFEEMSTWVEEKYPLIVQAATENAK